MPSTSVANARTNNSATSNNAAANRNGSNAKRRTGVHSNAEATSLLETVLSRKDKEHHQHQHNFPPSSSTGHPSLFDVGPSADVRDAESRKGGRGASVSGGNGKDRQEADSNQPARPAASAAVGGNGLRASTQSTLTNLASTKDDSPAPATSVKGSGRAVKTADYDSDAPAGTLKDDEDEGDNDNDNDDNRVYCYCQNVSYGEMIGCDDDSCRLEWFHLTCVGMERPPDGQWYCDECSQRRVNRRPSRGGKKKAAGGGAGRARGGS